MKQFQRLRKTCVALAVLLAGTGAAAQTAGLKLHYTFENVSGTQVPDASPSGVTAELKNEAKVFKMGKYHVLNLGKGTGYLDMGENAGKVVKDLADFSVSAYYFVEEDASLSGAGYFLWAFSALDANTQTAGPYMAYRLNAQRFATSTGGWGGEAGIEKGGEAAKGKWSHVLYRQSGATGELYIDGRLAGKNMEMPVLNATFTAAPRYCWIGRAPFSADNYLKGTYMTDFRVYDAAVTDEEVASLAAVAKDLDNEYFYGDPGDFSALKKLLEECEGFVAGASGTYLQNAVDEVQDEIEMARLLIAAATASQPMIDKRLESMQAALDHALTTAGITFGEVSHFMPENHGFVHPGGLHTQADFDRVKQMLADGDPTITAAMKLLRSNEYSQSGVATWPVETIIRGGGSGQNYINACRGAAMAYQNALRWKIDGTKANADGAVRILMAWARGNKYVSGDTNMSLAAGLTGYQFAQAAELMRDYEGWSRDDFEEFKRYMLKTWYPVACDFLRRRHDTWANWVQAAKGERPGHYWSNWGLCNVLCLMNIGILCDDVHIYNQGVSFYKYDHVGTFVEDRSQASVILNDGCNEFIGNLVPVVHADERGPLGYLGQMQESGRDQGHALMAAGLAVDICQVGLSQGDDLYAYMNDRLAAGLEWTAAYNHGGQEDLPWTPYNYTDRNGWMGAGWQMDGPNGGGRGGWRPYWDRVVGYYEGVRGVKVKYSEIAANAVRGEAGTDGGGGNYGQTSGGFDHLGFTTLMDYRPAIDPAKAPVVLSGQIVYNGETLKNQTNLGGLKYKYEVCPTKAVPVGGKATLMPMLPEGVADNGSWKWETGETTKDITVDTDRSYIYRVHYTADNGAVSTQSFAIAVAGDNNPDVIHPEITVDGVIYVDTVKTVLYGDDVILYAGNSTGWSDEYLWSNGKKGNLIVIPNITSDRTYTVQYTNQGGNVTSKKFYLKVVYGVPSVVVDGTKYTDCSEVVVDKGQNVELRLALPEGMVGGQLKWSDGSEGEVLTLEKLEESCSRTVEYIIGGNTVFSFTYNILVKETEDRLVDVDDYHIIERATGRYLTYTGEEGETPAFAEKDGDAPQTQIWTISRSSMARYDIISKLNNMYLDKSGVMRTMTMRPHRLQAAAGTMYFAIHNSATSGNIYWTVNGDGTVNYEGAPELYGYPFELVKALSDPDGIDGVTDNAAGEVKAVELFNAGGARIEHLVPGINIRKMYMRDGRVITDKIVVSRNGR